MKLCLLLMAVAVGLWGQEARVYKRTPQGELKVHVFVPEGGGVGRPAALFFFGGGFRAGTPEQFYGYARHLAKRGMVAVSAEYRVSSRHQTTAREAVEDCRDAMKWLLGEAERLGVDAGRVAFGGGSAGGGCALAASYAGGPKPGAWLLFNPVTEMGKFGAAELSPGPKVKAGDGPGWMVFGSEDASWLPPGRAFAEVYRGAGNRMELLIAPGQGHGFFNREPWLGASMEAMDRFLVSLGWLRGESGLGEAGVGFEGGK